MASSKMTVPHIQVCCCGCNLRTGSLIFAWINIVANIFYFGFTIAEMLMSPQDYAQKVLGIIQIVIYLGYTVVSLVLLFGIFKRELTCVKLWVVVACIFHAVKFFHFLEKYVILLAYEVGIVDTLEGFLIALEIISFGYSTYSIVVIYNFYRQLVSEENKKSEILMEELV